MTAFVITKEMYVEILKMMETSAEMAGLVLSGLGDRDGELIIWQLGLWRNCRAGDWQGWAKPSALSASMILPIF